MNNILFKCDNASNGMLLISVTGTNCRLLLCKLIRNSSLWVTKRSILPNVHTIYFIIYIVCISNVTWNPSSWLIIVIIITCLSQGWLRQEAAGWRSTRWTLNKPRLSKLIAAISVVGKEHNGKGDEKVNVWKFRCVKKISLDHPYTIFDTTFSFF